jgi:hypothetical protein
MSDSSTHLLELTKRSAALRFRELTNELHLLLELFPDLDDSFDADELPVSFILKRDARRTDHEPGTIPTTSRAVVREAVNRRMKQAWTRRRAGSKD